MAIKKDYPVLIRFSPLLYDRLQQHAAETDQNISAIVRGAVLRVIEEREAWTKKLNHKLRSAHYKGIAAKVAAEKTQAVAPEGMRLAFNPDRPSSKVAVEIGDPRYAHYPDWIG